jgi:hypothetical protein
MLNFPKIGTVKEPRLDRRMTLEEYVDFCESCLESNSRVTPENCLPRGEGIRVPFRLDDDNTLAVKDRNARKEMNIQTG